MGGNIPDRDFLGGNFPEGEFSREEFDGCEFCWRGFFQNPNIETAFSEALAQKCSVKNLFWKYYAKSLVQSRFFNKVDYVTVYFQFWFYKLFLLMEPFTSVPQSSCSAKLRKSNLKTPVTELFFIKVAELQTGTLQ